MSEERSAVFIDRDGTLNVERHFLKHPEDFQLIEGAGEAVRSLNVLGIPVCVISNQSGVARGFLTEDDLILVHRKMEADLERFGAHIDRVYYCPHHPADGSEPYRITCDCRKPAPGMLKRGARDLGIALERSFLVGDKLDDIRAGQSVGTTTFLVLTGYGRSSLETAQRSDIRPDHVVESLAEAVQSIIRIIGAASAEPA